MKIHDEKGNRTMPESPTKIRFERASVKVSDTRFETGAESFPIKKIKSVRIESEKRRTRFAIPLLVAGVGALLAGMFANIPVLIVSGAAFIVGGTMLCFASVNSSVVLSMRGRDITALSSKDSALIQAVAAALQEVIAERK